MKKKLFFAVLLAALCGNAGASSGGYRAGEKAPPHTEKTPRKRVQKIRLRLKQK
ncbi:hypothetical protein [Pantoea sp. F_16]|uniref:hypothetical protein n=1 Tax=unclassified Pantoea TaxID=2630326 RepID=UPI0034CE2D2E